MVVDENDTRRTFRDREAEDLPGMDEGGVQDASRDQDLPDHPVLTREEERVELFLTEIPEARLHEVEDVTRPSDAVPWVALLGTRAAPELERGRDPRCGSRSDAGNRSDRLRGKGSESPKRSPNDVQHLSRGGESRSITRPSNEDRNELSARESSRPQRGEPRTRAVLSRAGLCRIRKSVQDVRNSGRAGGGMGESDGWGGSGIAGPPQHAEQKRKPYPPRPWHFLYFLPDPHGQGWLRPGSFVAVTGARTRSSPRLVTSRLGS